MYLKARKDGRLGSNTIMLIHVVYLIKSFPLGVLKKRAKKISLLSSSRKKIKNLIHGIWKSFFYDFFDSQNFLWITLLTLKAGHLVKMHLILSFYWQETAFHSHFISKYS